MPLVFVSWSGEQSKAIADALTTWLSSFFPGLDVWMSEKDIQAGERWEISLAKQLEGASFGILCLTPDNIRSEWLIFEAGAMSKALNDSLVVPFRFALKATDVGPPLSQFQGVDADQEGTFRLVKSIHRAVSSPIKDQDLPYVFNKWWPDLNEALNKIIKRSYREVRTEREMLEEVLNLVRRTVVAKCKIS